MISHFLVGPTAASPLLLRMDPFLDMTTSRLTHADMMVPLALDHIPFGGIEYKFSETVVVRCKILYSARSRNVRHDSPKNP